MLAITIKKGAENILVGFPFGEGQYEDGGSDEDGTDNYIIHVNLGEVDDTTVAQEQHLNTNTDVIGYSIV